MAPPGVTVGVRPISDADIGALRAVERAHVAAARARRVREFASGRALLRQLIGRDVAVPAGDDRAPVLPPGIRGSLAHDDGYAVAALAGDGTVAAIGIDIESFAAPEPALAEVVVRADEGDVDTRLAFAAKEAVYKAWSSLGGEMLEHHDVRLVVDGDRFAAHIDGSGIVLHGRWTAIGDRWLALVVVGA